MPIGYVVSMALPAAATAIAVVPVRRSWRSRRLSWQIGFPVNEQPFVVAAWVVGWTVFTADEGAIPTVAGMVGLGLAILTITLLGLVVWRQGQAGPALERALGDGLIEGRRPETVRRRWPWIRILLAPVPLPIRNVQVTRNAPYQDGGPEHLLDVYQPRSSGAARPCLIHFHGGGYRGGHKSRECRPLLEHLAGRGWVCLSANYRLSPAAAYLAPLIDAKRVIAWARSHAEEHGIDPDTIFVAGSSAGAHLTAMVALTPNMTLLQPGFEQAETRIAGAICLYGFYDTPTWINRDPGAPSSPTDMPTAELAPMLIVHGTLDTLVSVSNARQFVDRRRSIAPGTPCVFAELPGAQHTFDFCHSIRFHAVIDAVGTFTDWVRTSRASESDAKAIELRAPRTATLPE